MDRGAWRATVLGVAKSRTQLSAEHKPRLMVVGGGRANRVGKPGNDRAVRGTLNIKAREESYKCTDRDFQVALLLHMLQIGPYKHSGDQKLKRKLNSASSSWKLRPRAG